MTDEQENKEEDRIKQLRGQGAVRFERDLITFVNYWQGMRRGGDVPLRSTIDPRGIETLLSQAFIAEKVAPGLARIRVAGTHLSDLMGMEVRGLPLSSLISPAHRDRLADALVNLFEEPAQIRLSLSAPGSLRVTTLTGALVLLPLRSDLGDISRALGCLVTEGTIGLTPRRFEITGCRTISLDLKVARSEDMSATSPRDPSAIKETDAASAPSSQPVPAQKLISERPYLRLVRND